jgi:hypothetical protein
MPLSWREIQDNSIAVLEALERCGGRGQQAQTFLNEFFAVFGIDRKRVGTFEKKVPMGKGRNGLYRSALERCHPD